MRSQPSHERCESACTSALDASRARLRETRAQNDIVHASSEDEEMITSSDGSGCGQCGVVQTLCNHCHNCEEHCSCGADQAAFDSDELGLDPETDNTPGDTSRHA